MRLGSLRPFLHVLPARFTLQLAYSQLRRGCTQDLRSCSPLRSVRIWVAGNVGISGSWSSSVAWLSLLTGCITSVPSPLAQSITPLSIALLVPVLTSPGSLRILWHHWWHSGVLLWAVSRQLTPMQHSPLDSMLTLQQIMCIHRCQLSATISEDVRVGGLITIYGTGSGFAASAPACACSSIKWVPKQLCPSHSQGCCEPQWNKASAHQYLVQLIPNKWSSSSKPPP